MIWVGGGGDVQCYLVTDLMGKKDNAVEKLQDVVFFLLSQVIKYQLIENKRKTSVFAFKVILSQLKNKLPVLMMHNYDSPR